MDTSVDGLRVLVTAGASGIGRAISDTFASAGARVYICDVDSHALETFVSERPDGEPRSQMLRRPTTSRPCSMLRTLDAEALRRQALSRASKTRGFDGCDGRRRSAGW